MLSLSLILSSLSVVVGIASRIAVCALVEYSMMAVNCDSPMNVLNNKSLTFHDGRAFSDTQRMYGLLQLLPIFSFSVLGLAYADYNALAL